MPYQDIEDCAAAVARAQAAADRIRDAVDRTMRLCTAETWQGRPADEWYGSYRELLRPVLEVLDGVPDMGGACLARVRAAMASGGRP
jgi:hypothetical protein